VKDLDMARGSSELPRGRLRRAGRTYAAGLALAGCVGVLAQPAPSADLTTIRLPPGFAIDVFARDLGFARFMTLDPRGTLLVSVPRAGRVLALPDDDRDGRSDAVLPVVEGLDLPHGLAFLDGQLYVAETGRVLRFEYDPATRRVRGSPTIVVPDLPPRGSHWSRTIAFGPDRRLYVAVGSSCNNCEERDGRRAAIYRYPADGREGVPFATGLRNAVGLTFRPGTNELWATVNGRDWLGDDRPAEYVTRVEEGGFYGWPYCHWTARGLLQDPDLREGDRCRTVRQPTVLYQAHAAPLGLVFYTGTQFPPEYQGSLLVALHGSWNRSEPVGYKVIRVRLDGATPAAEDFATGWLAGTRSWGRPVDLLVAPDGALFLSDDGLGAVYRITYRGP
jgi:glucose/arabinose dehydrogenase